MAALVRGALLLGAVVGFGGVSVGAVVGAAVGAAEVQLDLLAVLWYPVGHCLHPISDGSELSVYVPSGHARQIPWAGAEPCDDPHLRTGASRRRCRTAGTLATEPEEPKSKSSSGNPPVTMFAGGVQGRPTTILPSALRLRKASGISKGNVLAII